MTTSGTVGNTVFNNATIIEHATRRCGQSPSILTPEILDTATESLFLILTSIVNRGVNLWCIDKEIIGLNVNRAAYDLKAGTIDILNANYRTVTQLAVSSFTTTVDSYSADFGVDTPVKTVGFYYSVTRDRDLVVEVSTDNTTWAVMADLGTVTGYAGSWSWHDIDPSFATRYLRVRDTRTGSYTDLDIAAFVFATDVYEVPMSPMSRDTYNDLPNKRFAGRPLQYYFQKLVSPIVTFWPEPSDAYASVVVRRHRQVQDIGDLQNNMELPMRWHEAVTWQLAQTLAFELPNVDSQRREEVIALAALKLKEAEDGETDGSPIFIRPNIGVYTS